MTFIRKRIKKTGGIKSKPITKLFDIYMHKRVEIWNDKEINNTLTVPGSILL